MGGKPKKSGGKSKIPLIFGQCPQKGILDKSNIYLSFQFNLLINCKEMSQKIVQI